MRDRTRPTTYRAASPRGVAAQPGVNGQDPAQRYRDLLDSFAGAIIWEAAADTLAFTFVTESAEEILGYPVEQWLTEKDFWVSHLHPDDRNSTVSACLEATAQGEGHELEYRMIAADGREVWLRDTVNVVADAEAQPRVRRGLMFDISAQKRSLEALRASEARFAAAFNASPAAMTIVRASDRCVLDANETFLDVLGATRDEIIGRSAREIGILSDPADRERMERSLNEQGRIRNMEVLLATKSGEVRNIVGSSEIVEVDGETCVLSSFHDITERKRTEGELARAEEKYRGIIENAIFGIFQTTRDGHFLSANDAMGRILGYERGEDLIEQISDIEAEIHVDPARRRQLVAILEENGELHEFECELRRKDGRHIWASLSGRLRRDASGAILGYEGIIEDITERKAVQEALRESEARKSAVLDAAVDAIITIDESGIIQSVNPAATRLFGYEADEVTGTNVKRLMPNPYSQEHDRYLQHYLETGERKIIGIGREVVARRKDGTTFPIELTVSEVSLAGYRLFTGIIRDITERKRAERELERLLGALQAERQRISSVISDVPGVVWEAYGRPDSALQRIDFVSEHIEGMTGYKTDEWLSTPNFWLTIVHPEDRERAAAEAAAIFNSRTGGRNEFRWVAKDGRVIWVEAQSTVILDDAGEPIGMRGVTTDITSRKEAEEAVRAAEAQLNIVTNAVPALISYVDTSHRYVYVNRGYEDWFDQDPEEMRGRHLRDVLGARAYRKILPNVEKALAGEPVQYEDHVPYATGGTRWIHAEYIPHRSQGKVDGFVAMVMDISDRKRAEEEDRRTRQEAERRLSEEAAINRVAELLRTTLDLETLCQVALSEAMRVTETEYGMIAVRSGDDSRLVCTVGLPEESREPFRDLSAESPTALARALYEGRATFSPRGRLLTGSAIFLRASGASRFAVVPLIARGAVVGALEIAGRTGKQWSAEDREFLRRIAGHIALAISNAQAYQSIEEAFKRRDEGVRALSHEIRTPLTALKGFSQLALRHLERGPADPERLKDSLQEIAAASERLVRVAEQMLSASSVESGIARMRKERVPLGRFLRQAISEFNAENRPCPVRLASVPRALLYVDPQLIRQVLWNLLGNAMKYSPRGEPVIVRATKTVETATVSVIDRGPGVPKGDVQRLFEKFQSGSESRGGLGLGLYLARQVVEAHAGTMSYEPDERGGSVFSFTLPIRRFRP